MADTQNQLAVLIQETGLDAEKGKVLTSRFADYFTIAQQWKEEAQALVVTKEDQTELMKRARQGRLVLKDKRVQIEKTRKQLKEESLKEGRAIDQVAKMLTSLIEPTEKFLLEQESFAERAEAERAIQQQQLVAGRRAQFQLYGADALDEYFIKATKSGFEHQLDLHKRAHSIKQAELEAELQRQRQADQRNREELLKENQRLQEEQRRKDEAAATEKRRLEAELQKQRDQAQQQRDEERKRRAEVDRQAEQNRLLMQAQQQEKEANASDHEKLLAFAEAIDKIQGTVLTCKGNQAQQVVGNVTQLLTRASGFLREQADTLTKQAA